MRKPKVVRVYHGRLTGSSNLKRDRRYHAMSPGKRVSRTGHVYYEHRKNRADRHRRL